MGKRIALLIAVKLALAIVWGIVQALKTPVNAPARDPLTPDQLHELQRLDAIDTRMVFALLLVTCSLGLFCAISGAL